MATRTVIKTTNDNNLNHSPFMTKNNSNTPSATTKTTTTTEQRVISIKVDQDQEQENMLQAKQKHQIHETGKITIYQELGDGNIVVNNNNNNNNNSFDVENSTKSTFPVKTTLIGINRNNIIIKQSNDQNNHTEQHVAINKHHQQQQQQQQQYLNNNDVHHDDDQFKAKVSLEQQSKQTGNALVTTTTTTTQTTRTTTATKQLLKVNGIPEVNASQVNGKEKLEIFISDGNENKENSKQNTVNGHHFIGSAQATTTTTATTSTPITRSQESHNGICITHQYKANEESVENKLKSKAQSNNNEENFATPNDDVKQKAMIIECNMKEIKNSNDNGALNIGHYYNYNMATNITTAKSNTNNNDNKMIENVIGEQYKTTSQVYKEVVDVDNKNTNDLYNNGNNHNHHHQHYNDDHDEDNYDDGQCLVGYVDGIGVGMKNSKKTENEKYQKQSEEQKQQQQQESQQPQRQTTLNGVLTEKANISLITKADCASNNAERAAATIAPSSQTPSVLFNNKIHCTVNSSEDIEEEEEESTAASETSRVSPRAGHVLKIEIKTNSSDLHPSSKVSFNNESNSDENLENSFKAKSPSVTVVQVSNDQSENQLENNNHSQENNILSFLINNKNNLSLQLNDPTGYNTSDNVNKMVQRPSLSSLQSNSDQSSELMNNNNNNSSQHQQQLSHTTVTELNVVSNPQYLYYMMSSGQFSPCETLDSGTGSDLESSGNPNSLANTPQTPKTLNMNGLNLNKVTSNNNHPPKLELHLKTTKIRLNGKTECGGGGGMTKMKSNVNDHHERSGSLADSEESEESASSLSCDSLHSNEEGMRQGSTSPLSVHSKPLTKQEISDLIPDSLLRNIRQFSTSDLKSQFGRQIKTNYDNDDDVDDDDGDYEDDDLLDNPFKLCKKNIDAEVAEHTKFLKEEQEKQDFNHNNKINKMNDKVFTMNSSNGAFIDTKSNSMPRKYEADKFYNFHVSEHDNFRSFGNNNNNGNGNGYLNRIDDDSSLYEYDTKNLQEDSFAGYKDVRCGSASSTIRSAKGTVRGVKNRVRNGIATFLQLQQPHVKSYLEKDLGKVVLYTTSMGVIRETYAKCSNVKKILRTLLVKFEERDVFMSLEYQQEIKERMNSDVIKVPQLFVEGQHIGDAETVERLNESGELRQLLKPYKSIATTLTCPSCGGYRLLPCPSCNGSKKSVHRNHFTSEFVALKCMNCDEAGLVKCHMCS